MKWIEVEPLAKITEARVKDFIWKSIICRFDLPRILITEDDRQFNGFKLVEFCRNFGISYCFTFVGHPQANVEAKIANITLLLGLKIRLDYAKGMWAEELHHIL